MNRIFNSLVNKITWILIIAIVGLTCFFFGLYFVDAAEVSKWGQYDSNYIDSFTSDPWYTYTDYDSDTIKEFIFEKTNEQYFDNTKTIEEFYSNFTYIVYAYNQTTIRVLVQNNALTIDNMGIDPITDEIQFYFANMTLKYIDGLYSQYRGGISAIYSYYIDIDYNTKSYSFSGDNPLTDIKFYGLGYGSKYVSNADPSDSSKLNININCLDSFNNNFAWIEYWNQITNNTTLWNQVAGFTPSKSSQYFNSPDLEFPQLDYVSSGVNPVPPEEPEEPGSDNSEVVDKIEESNTILGAILDKVDELIDTITDSVDDFTDTIGDFFNGFTEIDPNGISGIVSLPLKLIRGIINNDSCQPLTLVIWGKEVQIPSGCIMWEQASDSVITVWHTVICGLGSYYILVDAFKIKDRLLDPDSKEVDTLDL